MKKTQLSKLQRLAAAKTPTAKVTHERKSGYWVTLNNEPVALGKDSIEAYFKLEKLLGRTA